jgi:hypothetical protein
MHEEAHLLNGILQVGPSQSEVLKGTHYTPVVGGINRREKCTIRGRELGMSVNRSRCRVTLSHACTLQKVHSILSLGQKETVGGASDGDAEEVVEVAEVSHGELRIEFGHDVLEKSRRRSGEDDVVDVEQQVGDLTPLLVNKEGGVGSGGDKTELAKERGESLVPRPGSLLEPVQGPLEQADVVGSGRVDETRRLLAVDSLLKVTMKESVLHIELVKRPTTGRGNTQDSSNGRRFDNRTEGLVVVDTSLLVVAANHPAGLVTGKSTIGVVLKREDPLARHNIGTRRSRDKTPCVVVDESLVLSHCRTLVRVSQPTPVVRRDR